MPPSLSILPLSAVSNNIHLTYSFTTFFKKKINTIRTELKQGKNTKVSNIYVEYIFYRVSHEPGVDSENLKTEYEKGSRIIVFL